MHHNTNKGRLTRLKYISPLALILLLVGCKPATPPPPDMVHVPKGEFTMGSDKMDKEAKAMQYGFKKPLYANERPSRKVILDDFHIDKTEVTNGKYEEFIKATGHKPPSFWTHPVYVEKKADMANYPVIFVNWEDADTYCKWKKRRLPTEAEWEKAARGTDGRRFPWGSEFDIELVNALGKYGGVGPAGSFPEGASPYGALDMAGNVWEWTADWYTKYPNNEFDDEDYGEKYKVIRGGGWGGIGHYSLKTYSSTTFRKIIPVDRGYDDLGFRCVWP